MKTRSLTRTLMLGVLLAEFLCAVVFSSLALLHEAGERRRAFDVMLRGRADSLLGAIHDAEDTGDNVAVDPTELSLPPEDAYQVLMASGRVIGIAPGLSGDMLQAMSKERPDGYFGFKANGRGYRAIRQPGIRVIDRDEQKGGIRRPVTIVYAAPTEHLWHETFEAVRFYVLASCLLLLITGAAISWFLRGSLSPLRELAARAERVSTASWDFRPPVGALETRELQPIAASIQKLLLGLKASFDRQRQFTGDAAHELKTSIAVLKSSHQLLLMRERTPFEYRLSMEDLLTDIQRMEELIARMLTLARVEQAPLSDGEISHLWPALSAVVERLRPAADLKRISISLSQECDTPVAIAPHDAELLCSNLLMNAIQHSPPLSTIDLSIQEADGSVELRIADQGVGIPAEALPYVFERFYRADSSRSRANGGAGLGLAICKAIVERGGGAISVYSEPGRSTTVTVILPRAAQEVAVTAG